MRPPGLTAPRANASTARCSTCRSARFAGRIRHFASGRRRHTPEPEHGASTSTRSKRGPSAASAVSSPPRAPARCARRPASTARRSGAGAAGCRRRRRSGRCSASPPPAPASCRRRPRKDRAPAGAGSASASNAAIWLPSSCTSNQPLPWPASASTLGVRPGAWRRGDANAHGDSGVGVGAEPLQRLQHLVAVGLQRVDAQIDRRAPRQRRAFLACALAERPRERRRQPIRDSRRARDRAAS